MELNMLNSQITSIFLLPEHEFTNWITLFWLTGKITIGNLLLNIRFVSIRDIKNIKSFSSFWKPIKNSFTVLINTDIASNSTLQLFKQSIFMSSLFHNFNFLRSDTDNLLHVISLSALRKNNAEVKRETSNYDSTRQSGIRLSKSV